MKRLRNFYNLKRDEKRYIIPWFGYAFQICVAIMSRIGKFFLRSGNANRQDSWRIIFAIAFCQIIDSRNSVSTVNGVCE